MFTKFEHLSNDVLLDIFDYVDIGDLYHGFWGLNSRLNNVMRSLNNLSLVVPSLDFSKDYESVIPVFGRQIKRLAIKCRYIPDLKQCPNLHTLILRNASHQHIDKILPEYVPNLVSLKISSLYELLTLDELIYNILSNRFPFLRHGDFNIWNVRQVLPWSQSLSLRSLCIVNQDLSFVPVILNSCPHLDYLKVSVMIDTRTIPVSSTPNRHPLKRFILRSVGNTLSLDTVQILFGYMLNVEYVFLNFDCTVPFFNFTSDLATRLHHLRRFDCQILECLDANQNDDIAAIRQIHPCFNRIQSMTICKGVRRFYFDLHSKVDDEWEDADGESEEEEEEF
ncbi:unnamed protein product [Sphagnum troendelagicum]|uniref:F-box domain-containing protein n=1 Tax=Sphagnum troendelagicum TaxID=128251 RepID=A0ABP0T6T1_9BRYO